MHAAKLVNKKSELNRYDFFQADTGISEIFRPIPISITDILTY